LLLLSSGAALLTCVGLILSGDVGIGNRYGRTILTQSTCMKQGSQLSCMKQEKISRSTSWQHPLAHRGTLFEMHSLLFNTSCSDLLAAASISIVRHRQMRPPHTKPTAHALTSMFQQQPLKESKYHTNMCALYMYESWISMCADHECVAKAGAWQCIQIWRIPSTQNLPGNCSWVRP